MATTDKIFAARILDLDIFEKNGDRVGRIRDIVITPQNAQKPPQVIGLIVEDNNRKRLFLRMEKIEDMTNHQVVVKNFDNVKRFEKRGNEKLIAGEVFDQELIVTKDNSKGTIEDVAFIENKGKYYITDFYIRQGKSSLPFGRFRKGNTKLIAWQEASHNAQEIPQAATQFIEVHSEENPADFAAALNEMPQRRRVEIAAELSNERLATVLAEMNEDDQITIIEALKAERAVQILEEMEPDDAADLVSELPQKQADNLLNLMEPDDAAEMRRLLSYDDNVAGALMTPVPLILPPEANVAEALAHIQQEDISPANASTVFVCRPPLETPTGTYLGSVHFQRLLRTPPGEAVGTILDKAVPPISDQTPIARVVRQLATYDLVTLPVVNQDGYLVGAITVDDVLDHILPEDWRDQDEEHHDIELGEG